MAVSDPILKELKGHLVSLMKLSLVNDDSLELLSFCDCLERIFARGFYPQNFILGLAKRYDCWKLFTHLASISEIPYGFQSSVELAQKTKKVKSYQGKLRLCIRSLIMKKSMHVPVQYILRNSHIRKTFYDDHSSILGDEILCEMFLSLCFILKNINFKLELSNSRFLDETWLLPSVEYVTLVPCSELGISIVFVDDKAIIVNVIESSVALESGSFQMGDILDEINGIEIHDAQQGVLRSIVKRAKGQPVTALVIKAHLSDSLYPPLVNLIKTAGIDPFFVLNGERNDDTNTNLPNITYLGFEETGKRSNVRQIQTSIIRMLNAPLLQKNVKVRLDCQELGVLMKRSEDGKLLYSHKYMQISSCGRTVNNPQYFGYIVDNKETNVFECHMFYCADLEVTDSILLNIGQGFMRTHYAV